MLIADQNITQVDKDTKGIRFDWGSGHFGRWRKANRIPQTSKFDFQKAQERSITWDYIGTTNWNDEDIKELLTRLGVKYHLFLNNCRVWTTKAALALVLPSQSPNVNGILEAEACVDCFNQVREAHEIMIKYQESRIRPETDHFRVGLTAGMIDRYMRILEHLPDQGYYDTSDRAKARGRLELAIDQSFNTAGESTWDEAFGSRLGTIQSFREQPRRS